MRVSDPTRTGVRSLTGVKVAIHQPNYLPWLGYFYKMWLSDSFVFLDHVAINKTGFTRRTLIPNGNKLNKSYLTVPLKAYKTGSPISNVLIDHSKNWADYHIARLYQLYHKSPFIKDYWDEVKSWYREATKYEDLNSLNIFFITRIAESLGCSRKTFKSSDLVVKSSKDETNAEIVKLVGGTTYISGRSGLNYRNEKAFSSRNIVIEETDFLDYFISNNSFTLDPTVCILDALFNLGKGKIIELFENCYVVESIK